MDVEQLIIEKSGSSPNECSCTACQDMCKHCPCIGIPSEILAIAEAGYADKITRSVYMVGTEMGLEPVYNMFVLKRQNENDENSPCVFFTSDGKCQLHDVGLKPMEGRLASCKKDNVDNNEIPHYLLISRTWTLESNQHIIDELENIVEPDPDFEKSQFAAKLMYQLMNLKQ